jgi:hypothetical protein
MKGGPLCLGKDLIIAPSLLIKFLSSSEGARGGRRFFFFPRPTRAKREEELLLERQAWARALQSTPLMMMSPFPPVTHTDAGQQTGGVRLRNRSSWPLLHWGALAPQATGEGECYVE